jgi:hypothetical protein
MNRTTKRALVGAGVVGVMILQAAATFAVYPRVEMIALTVPLAFVLQLMLFSHVRPWIAVASATALAPAGAIIGLFPAIRMYGA